MKVFVTGATGYLGSQLALELAKDGETVHILYRDEKKTATLNHPNIKAFFGSLLDSQSVKTAMEGCTNVFHVAAVTSVWERDPIVFDRTNVDGTACVLKAAQECGVARLVFTSTAGVFGPSQGTPINENHRRTSPMLSDYDRTKTLAEDVVREHIRLGLDAVIVNPTRIFGPSGNNPWASLNGLIKQYVDGKFHVLPGDGSKVGNYVYVDDVVAGHRLAMSKGGTGERYILAGANLSYREFFDLIGRASSQTRLLVPTPVPVMKIFAGLHLMFSNLVGNRPRITPRWISRFGFDYLISHEKASRELGYSPRPIDIGMALTVQWIRRTA